MDLIKNNISIKSYLNKIVKFIQIEHTTMKSFKNYSKYFIAVALIYKYSKISKTYLIAIFGFIDLKLLQIYSNSPFEI